MEDLVNLNKSWVDRITKWERCSSGEHVPDASSSLTELAQHLNSITSAVTQKYAIEPLHSAATIELLECLFDVPLVMTNVTCSHAVLRCLLSIINYHSLTTSKPSSEVLKRAGTLLVRITTQLTSCISGTDSARTFSFWGHSQYDLHLTVIRQCCQQICSQLKTSSHPVDGCRLLSTVNSCHLGSQCHPDKLVAIACICLAVHRQLDLADFLACILSHVFVCHSDLTEVDAMCKEIDSRHAHHYTGNCDQLPYECQVVLWTNRLSLLEAEVLDLVQWVRQTPVTSSDILLQRADCLIRACSEKLEILTMVFSMLHFIYTQSSGHPAVAWLISCISRAVMTDNVKIKLSCFLLKPDECCTLGKLLHTSPSSLTVDACMYYIGQITTALNASAQHGAEPSDIFWLLVHFSDWGQIALTLCYHGDKKLVGSCIQLLTWYSGIHSEEILCNQLLTVATSLKALLSKSTLHICDVKCVIADTGLLSTSESMSQQHRRAHVLTRKLVLMFICHSLAGASIAEPVLTQMCGATNREAQLGYLVEVLRVVLDIPADWVRNLFSRNRGIVEYIERLASPSRVLNDNGSSLNGTSWIHSAMISDVERIVKLLS